MASKGGKTNEAMRIFYAIAIVMVVAGHSVGDYAAGANLLYNFFPPYAVHLPMFLFAAGYFYNERHDRHPLRFVWGKAKRLVIPMYAIHLAIGIIVTGLQGWGYRCGLPLSWENVFLSPWDHTNCHVFALDGPMWFVAPMFLACCAYMASHALVVHGRGKVRVALDLACNAAWIAVGAYAMATAHGEMFNLDGNRIWAQTAAFLGFMAIGHLYRTYLERHLERVPDGVAIPALLVAQLACMWAWSENILISLCWLDFPNGWQGAYAIGCIGILFWLRVSKILAPRLGRSRAVTTVGDNTFSIMAWHPLAFLMLNLMFLGIMLVSNGALFSNLDTNELSQNLWYAYVPKVFEETGRVSAWTTLYVMAGLAFPVVWHSWYAWGRARLRAAAGRGEKAVLPEATYRRRHPEADGDKAPAAAATRRVGTQGAAAGSARPAARPHGGQAGLGSRTTVRGARKQASRRPTPRKPTGQATGRRGGMHNGGAPRSIGRQSSANSLPRQGRKPGQGGSGAAPGRQRPAPGDASRRRDSRGEDSPRRDG